MADISKIRLPDGSKYNIKDTTARSAVESIKTNLTVTGQLGDQYGKVVTSKGLSTTNVSSLFDLVRYTNGCMGSVSFSAAQTISNYTILATWYHYIWIPHRDGADHGQDNGDNCNYGALILYKMLSSSPEGYLIYSNSSLVNLLTNSAGVILSTQNGEQLEIDKSLQARKFVFEDQLPTIGTSSHLGLTKIYNNTGTNTDGTITQAALTGLIVGITRRLDTVESTLKNVLVIEQ